LNLVTHWYLQTFRWLLFVLPITLRQQGPSAND
jgi:uncharacterized membrane protein YoaT (DUF817 family)